MITHSTHSRVSVRRLPWVALGLSLGVACSLTLNLAEQESCQTDSECIYTIGQGRCESGICVPPGSASPGTGDPADNTGSSGISLCELNSDCQDDQRCADQGECISLLSAECNTVEWPDDERDNVVFIGSVMPTSDIFEVFGQPLENALRLALEDFNNTARLPGGRKIAWVGCDSSGRADMARSAAEHLRDTVGAPAIIGPILSESVRVVAESVTVPSDIFLISPTASAPSLSDLDDNNLVWQVTPSDIYQASALVDRFLTDLDPAPARMLILNKDDAYGNELQQMIATKLVNNLGSTQVYVGTYAPPEDFSSMDDLLSSYGEVLGQALSQPGVAQTAATYTSPDDHYTHILILGTSEAQALILSYLGIWGSLYSAFAPFPQITVSHGAVPSLEDTVQSAQENSALTSLAPLLQTSLRGTTPNIFDPDNFTAFNIRYKIRYNDQEAVVTSSTSYDATMATIFALATIPEGQAVTGSAIAQGMGRLADPSGTAISFGEPVNIFVQAARNALVAGNTIDLQGVSGALNWNVDNGEIRADVVGWDLGDGTLGEAALLDPSCTYALNPAPAIDGTWISQDTMMPPCG